MEEMVFFEGDNFEIKKETVLYLNLQYNFFLYVLIYTIKQ